MTPHKVLKALGAGLDRAGAGDPQGADHLDHPGLGFGGRGRGLTEHGSGDLFGVEPVGLAVHVPGQPVGSVHLDDPFAGW